MTIMAVIAIMDVIAIVAVIDIMAVICVMTMIAFTATMALMNGFKCYKGFNFSSGSGSCIVSNDPKTSYDVLTVMAMIEWPHWL